MAQSDTPYAKKQVSIKSIHDCDILGWRKVDDVRDARPSDEFCFASMSGDGLTGEGILDGDCLQIRLTFEEAELIPGRLVAAMTPYGLLIKHLYRGMNAEVRLVSANPDYEDIVFDAARVSVQGVVVRVAREL